MSDHATCSVCSQPMDVDSCAHDQARIRWGQETHLAVRAQYAAQRGVEDPIANPLPADDEEVDAFFRLCNIGPYVGDRRCPDCNVAPGGLHHPGCDTEECPTCHLQALGCEHA